jgi:hypothetical protein
MRLPRVRFSLWTLLAFVALAASSLGAERLWQRSRHYRKQAALCAYFELQCRWHAETATDKENWIGLNAEEKQEQARGNLIESHRYGALKDVYQRIARHPWESLPPDTPASVNGWDLGSLPAQEIEEMVRDWEEERRAGQT